MNALLYKTREEIQEEWKEFNYIVERCNDLGFEYVLLPESLRSKGICFGSNIPREVLPMRGPALSSFMRKFNVELNNRLGPGVYYTHRLMQPQGPNPSCLTSKVPRFIPVKSKYLVDGFHNVEPKKSFDQDKKPFKIGARARETIVSKCKVPGVGTYTIQLKDKSLFKHSFGGKINLIPPVKVICSPQNTDRCINCLEEDEIDNPPTVDYWKNFESEVVYCRKCMDEEKKKAIYHSKTKFMKMKRLNELNNGFQLVRYCGIYHSHECTTAKFQLMAPEEFTKKLRREHYLSQFKIKFK